MKNKKCGNCGASVDVDSVGKCKYCGSAFSKEEDNRPIVINNYYTVEKNVVRSDYSKKDRDNPYVEEESYEEKHAPEINLFLCIFLFLVFPIAGFIYLLYKISKSKGHNKDE